MSLKVIGGEKNLQKDLKRSFLTDIWLKVTSIFQMIMIKTTFSSSLVLWHRYISKIHLIQSYIYHSSCKISTQGH